MTNLDLPQLKAVALATHQDVEFFIYDGQAYLGSEEGEREAHQAHCEHIDEKYPFSDWLETEGELMPDYEEGGDDCYMVLTDMEADDLAADYIRESLCAFNPDFLAGETGIDSEVFEAIAANGRCESNNDAIARLIGDNIDSFIETAIACDGRAHFLNTYDGHEHEISVKDYSDDHARLYVYRVN
jgi:hypothetical protein